jgi:hypothetical protein
MQNCEVCILLSLWTPDPQKSLLLDVQLRDENSTDRLGPMSARMMGDYKRMDGVCLPRLLDLLVQLHKVVTQADSSPQALAKFQCQYQCIAALWLKRSLA